MTLLETLAAMLIEQKRWAGVAIGLLAFGESLVVVGTVIPATPALFLIGTLLGSGVLDPLAVLPWAMIGAISGYWLSWWLGRRIGYRAYRFHFLAPHRRKLARVRLYFRRWGGPSLIFGRYLLGPFQSALPLAAGIAGMNERRFHAWNVSSGIIWVLVVLAPGFLAARGMTIFGMGIDQQRSVIGALILISTAMILIVLAQAAWHIWGPRARE